MATLQKIRSKGPLLLIVIGLAMLAFILGDAWKIIRPNQGVQYVGEIDGESISAMDYQAEVENYTEVVKFELGTNDLTEEQNAAIKDEVWSIMVRRKILEKEAGAIGLTVTDAEVRDVIEKGTDPILSNTPFNDANGKFDVDYLKQFIAYYDAIDPSEMSAQEYASIASAYKYWLFIEDNIKSSLLYSKYVSLVTAGIKSNPIASKNAYETRTKRTDVLLASIPYSSIPDSAVKVTSADIKKMYAENKEMLFNYSENRDIVYIDYEILPSEADRAALGVELNELTSQLEETQEDYDAFLRRAGSNETYSEVARSESFIPEDVFARFASVNAAGRFGPYYNEDDDTWNAFKLISKEKGYDSIQYCIMQIATGNAAEDARISDSICTAVKKGADFAEIAAKYSQIGTAQWIGSENYEAASLSGDNAAYLNALNSMKKGDVNTLAVKNGYLVIKLEDFKNQIDKYKAAVVKRSVEFSDETSKEAYDKLSLFVAANPTVKQLRENAENEGFHLLYYPGFESYSYNVGGVAKSHEALRWLFEASEDEVSRIYEAGSNNDHLLVVGLEAIHEQGYRSIKDKNVLSTLTYKAANEKKFETISQTLAKAATMAEAKNIAGVRMDTVKYVNFTNSAYISNSMANENNVGPAVYSLDRDVLSAPIKGDGCVFVAQKIAPDEFPVEFDQEAEDSRVEAVANRQIGNGILQELYFQAGIVDDRYKIF